jgi:hypothetical protein
MSKNYFADNSEQQAEHPTKAETKPSYRSGASIQKRIVLVHDQSRCNFENLSRIFVSLAQQASMFSKLPLITMMASFYAVPMAFMYDRCSAFG